MIDTAAASPREHVLDWLRSPFAFAYRRSGDEELYYNVARALRGEPYDRAFLRETRGPSTEAFERLPPSDGRWHAPYREVPLEYPAFMLPFLVVPSLFASSFDGFGRLFGGLMAICLLTAIALALDSQPARSAPGARREGWWLAVALLLAQGGLAIQRLDAVPALLLALALWAAAKRHPAGSGVAAGFAAAAKLVPVLLVPPFLAAAREHEAPNVNRRAFERFAAGFALALAVGLGPMLVSRGALEDLLRFHAQRGLQVESTYGIALGAARLLTGTAVASVHTFGSYNLEGAVANAFAALAMPITLVAIAALTWALLRPERAVTPRSAEARIDAIASALLAGLAILWLTSKVFSPQYLTWALPLPLAISGRRGRALTWALVAAMATTQLYHRGFYDFVTEQRALGIVTLLVRQGILVAILVVTLRGLFAGTVVPVESKVAA